MSLRRTLVFVLPVLILAAGGVWVLHAPATESAPASADLTSASPELSTPAEPATRAPVVVARAEASAAAASIPSVRASLAARVDTWARSRDPHDAMQAYQSIFKCLLARRRAHAANLAPDNSGEDATTLCSDLRSDQIQRRLSLLERAARAGEPEAAIDFIEEGPSGSGVLEDLGTIDQTPATQDWLARRNDYIERGLAHCDKQLALLLGVDQRDEGDRVQAVAYWYRRTACDGQPAANSTPLADDPQGLAYLDRSNLNDWQRQQ